MVSQVALLPCLYIAGGVNVGCGGGSRIARDSRVTCHETHNFPRRLTLGNFCHRFCAFFSPLCITSLFFGKVFLGWNHPMKTYKMTQSHDGSMDYGYIFTQEFTIKNQAFFVNCYKRPINPIGISASTDVLNSAGHHQTWITVLS